MTPLRAALGWHLVPWGECPRCGDSIEVETTVSDGLVYDGDRARCADCGLHGCASVDEDLRASIDWEEFDDG